MNRPKALLVVLLCLLVMAAVSAWFRMPRQKTVDRLTYQQGKAAPQTRENQTAKAVELREDILQQQPAAVVVTKNIFKSPVAQQKVNLAGKNGTLAAGPRPQPAPVVVPPTPQELARRQLAGFIPLGTYTKKDARMAFLSRGDEIVTVRVGDSLIPGYTVVSILDEQLILRSADGKDEIAFAL